MNKQERGRSMAEIFKLFVKEVLQEKANEEGRFILGDTAYSFILVIMSNAKKHNDNAEEVVECIKMVISEERKVNENENIPFRKYIFNQN